jgi:hypothetical protein
MLNEGFWSWIGGGQANIDWMAVASDRRSFGDEAERRWSGFLMKLLF